MTARPWDNTAAPNSSANIVLPTPSTPSIPTRSGWGQATPIILRAAASINSERFIEKYCGGLCHFFTEAEKISVGIFDRKVLAGPGSLFKRSNDMSSPRLQLIEQRFNSPNPDVGVEVLVLFAVSPIRR